MLWYQNRLLMVLFDDAHFWPKMRMKINVLAKTNMGSTSTPRPNQRHQQVAWAYSTTSVSFFWRNKPYIDFDKKNFALNAFELWRALASSGELWQNLWAAVRSSASSGKGSQWVPMTM